MIAALTVPPRLPACPAPRSGALVLEDGQLRWPAPPLPAPAAPPKKAEEAKKKELTPEEIYADTLRGALTTSERRRGAGAWGCRNCCRALWGWRRGADAPS